MTDKKNSFKHTSNLHSLIDIISPSISITRYWFISPHSPPCESPCSGAVLFCEIIVSINTKMNTVKVEWRIILLGGLGWVERMLECSARLISIVSDMMDICQSGIAKNHRLDDDRGCTPRRAARLNSTFSCDVHV